MEVKQVKRAFEELRYVLEKTSGDKEQIEQAYSLIDGFDMSPDFGFHDSKPIYFEHTKDRAVLRLEYDGVTAELLFEGLIEIEVNGDPLTNWIGSSSGRTITNQSLRILNNLDVQSKRPGQ